MLTRKDHLSFPLYLNQEFNGKTLRDDQYGESCEQAHPGGIEHKDTVPSDPAGDFRCKLTHAPKDAPLVGGNLRTSRSPKHQVLWIVKM